MSDRAPDLALADLLPAFAWDCPRCGNRNFVAATPHEGPPPEEAAALGLEGQWLEAPKIVRCEGYKLKEGLLGSWKQQERCNAVFETREV